jgi:hypothetical protein
MTHFLSVMLILYTVALGVFDRGQAGWLAPVGCSLGPPLGLAPQVLFHPSAWLLENRIPPCFSRARLSAAATWRFWWQLALGRAGWLEIKHDLCSATFFWAASRTRCLAPPGPGCGWPGPSRWARLPGCSLSNTPFMSGPKFFCCRFQHKCGFKSTLWIFDS